MKFLIGTILLMCLAQTITGSYVLKIYDPTKFLETMDTIKEVFIYEENTPYGKDALEVYMYLRSVFTNYTVDKFSKSIVTKTGFYSKPMITWREKIYNYNNEMYRQIMKQSINNAYPYVDENIIFDLFTFETTHLKFAGYTAILEVLKSYPITKKPIHINTYFKFAFKLRKFLEPFIYPVKTYSNRVPVDYEYFESPVDFTYAIEYMKTLLPTTVLSAVFDKVICIRNAAFNEYLYATSAVSGPNRPVLGKKPDFPTFSDKHKFIVELQLDYTFRIKSAYYNEYLYASPVTPLNVDHKSVYYNRTVALYTIKEEATPVTGSRWVFEIVYDNLVMKSVAYSNEYLFMSAPTDKYPSTVYTTNTIKMNELYLPAVWTFEECELMQRY